MTIVSRTLSGRYQDSVRLMTVSARLSALPGVVRGLVAMGTPANLRVLAETGLLTAEAEAAGATDLVIVVEAESAERAEAALLEAETLLAEAAGGDRQGGDREGGAGGRAESLAEARERLPGANLALVSVPGAYAALEASTALYAGLHVFLFSDNVSLDQELWLKRLAGRGGQLMMGPGCGTAIVGGVALGFANAVRRGAVGVVAASGTGLQELTVLVDRGGGGISQAIGVGGRDLSAEIGGLMTRQALAMLAADPATEVIALVSKPPAPEVVDGVLAAARATGKPIVANFLGDPRLGESDGVTFTDTLEDTAAATLAAAGLGEAERRLGEESGAGATMTAERGLAAVAKAERSRLAPGQQYLRGLFSGGSLCDEAMEIALRRLPAVYSNIPLEPGWALADAWESREHCFIDLGEEEFTQGRPHPMIDPRLRAERLLREAQDPEVAVVLLDIVLGYGSHDDPAGALAEPIREARAVASAAGRYLAVVAHVCGTERDPQGLATQETRLRAEGAIVLPTNAQAARFARAIVAAES